MLKLKTTLKDGRLLIMLGLSQINVERLMAGEPIYFDMDQLKVAEGERIGAMAVFYGVDEAAMTHELQTLMGRDATVLIVPRGDERPI